MSIFDDIRQKLHSEVYFYLDNKGEINRFNDFGHSLLHSAILSNDFLIILKVLEQFCIRNKELINHQDSQGNTALNYAALNGELGICLCLIKHGANRDIFNLKHENMLDFAYSYSKDFHDKLQNKLKELNKPSIVKSEDTPRSNQDEEDNSLQVSSDDSDSYISNITNELDERSMSGHSDFLET